MGIKLVLLAMVVAVTSTTRADTEHWSSQIAHVLAVLEASWTCALVQHILRHGILSHVGAHFSMYLAWLMLQWAWLSAMLVPHTGLLELYEAGGKKSLRHAGTDETVVVARCHEKVDITYD